MTKSSDNRKKRRVERRKLRVIEGGKQGKPAPTKFAEALAILYGKSIARGGIPGLSELDALLVAMRFVASRAGKVGVPRQQFVEAAERMYDEQVQQER